MRKKIFTLFISFSILFSNCGYNQIQELDEDIKAQMAEVLNQYKRRADLIPSLVKVVEGYASHEKEVLTEVTKARSSVGSIKATPELINDAAAFQKFQEAQNTISGALQRLLLVTENYPNLKADQGFRDLQVQLEGTENRIAVARGRYIKSVQEYNTYIRKFPTVITAKIFGYEVKPSLSTGNDADVNKIDGGVDSPPTIEFGNKK